MGNEDKNIFIVILILLIVGGIFYFYSPKFQKQVITFSSTLASIIDIQKDVEFAGYIWDVTAEGNLYQCADDPSRHPGSCSNAGGSYSLSDEGFIILEGYASSGVYCIRACMCRPPSASQVCMTTKEDISNIDEFLIIWSGHKEESSGFSINLYDKSTRIKKGIKSAKFDVSGNLDPELIKFMNNFDGTYTTYTTLGIGDIFIKDKTVNVSDFQSIHLQICVGSGAGCTWGGSGEYGKGELKMYNIVTKRLEAPICKAGEVLLLNSSCENLESILLAHESAIYESLFEKIARIEERLKAREEGLQRQIDELEELLEAENRQEQIDLINKALEELNEKLRLADNTEEINRLNEQINNLKEQIDLLEDEEDIERMEQQIDFLVKELELTVKSAEAEQIKDQIEFYESQLALLETESSERFTWLEKELILTKQILDGIQSGELMPPPDIDIEEVVKKVSDRLDESIDNKIEELRNSGLSEEDILKLIRKEKLSEEEIQEMIEKSTLSRADIDELLKQEILVSDEELKEMISEEMNIQFQERFPTGLQPPPLFKLPKLDEFSLIPVLIGGGIILLLIIIFGKRR